MARKRRATRKIEQRRGKSQILNDTPNPVNNSESIKLIDINFDCLEHIYKFIDGNDLLNVADTCTQLREVATSIFVSKYKPVYLQLNIINEFQQNTTIRWEKCSINDFKICLKFLRCFGHTMDCLKLNYNDTVKWHCIAIDKYVNKYCAKTLKIMEMHNAQRHTMSQIQKPFLEVFSLEFDDCDLAQPLLNM